MPELPEVETVRRTLLPHLCGQTLAEVTIHEPRLRWPVDTTALGHHVLGREVLGLRRRSKYLLVDLAPNKGAEPAVLMVHLGMSGWLGVVPKGAPRKKHDHASFALRDGRVLRYNDPRRFGSIHAFAATAEATHPLLCHLGPEPLDLTAFDGKTLWQAARNSQRSIKGLLMDAAVVVGVGNIYANEALFLAGIHPASLGHKLSLRRAETLACAVRAVLADAIELGGTTLRDFSNADGLKGMFAPRLRIYGREALGCVGCKGPVRKFVLQGRSTYVCRSCQRR